MGTTCACFREPPAEEFITINKETFFVKPSDNPDLVVDIIPITEQTSEVYIKAIVKLQSLFRGYVDRKQTHEILSTVNSLKNQIPSNSRRFSLLP